MSKADKRIPANDPASSAEARNLAVAQLEVVRGTTTSMVALERGEVPKLLEEAQERLLEGPSSPEQRQPTEWFLDNYHLIRRAARQVDQEMPPRFVARLPRLATGTDEGRPRVYALARALLSHDRAQLDGATLDGFVASYQDVATLTIAELWALPTMLRLAVLFGLIDSLRAAGLLSEHHAPAPQAAAELGLGGIERAVRSLRWIADIDWKDFFKRTSRVEAVLQGDPAKVYARMDFATCDQYRKAVEELAWATSTSEETVATRAVALAKAQAGAGREGHVGFFLVDAGRLTLERALDYTPSLRSRVGRLLERRPTAAYLSALGVSTVLLSFAAVAYAVTRGAGPLVAMATFALTLLPASTIALTMLHAMLARLTPPRGLPKLDFEKGIAEGARTLVVMPTLLGRASEVDTLVRTLELHYLSNPDPQLGFALLTDDVDATSEVPDPTLRDRAARGIEALNEKHRGAGAGPFHLLHRAPRWNEGERRFMGWERKRGKLDELNRLLRGHDGTSFERHVGDPAGLRDIRFVITLDSDTELPMGSANRLVGLMAHPLNRAVFDERTGRIVAGYSIAQPRIETSPMSERDTSFSQIYAGDVGYDIYSHASSNVYQDLFASAIYVGKGIYDVDAFVRSVDGRVPENALTSHDLFEGALGRVALASDVVLFENYPSCYVTHARRLHRWVRGDWQLLPWLLPKVPTGVGGRSPNPLPLIERWKILDNLRRSLTSPALVLVLVSAWTFLPGSALAWTVAAVLAFISPQWPALLGPPRKLGEAGARALLALTFAAHQATAAVDAIVRVAVRTAITRRRLLEWTSAAHTAAGLRGRSLRATLWRDMVGSPLIACAIGVALARLAPTSLASAAPLLALWLLAPEIARWVSLPKPPRRRALRTEDRRPLRLLARRTWFFFETFVGPGDQWLPIDNYQAEPREQTAHRTSPTNIGMMLVSTLSAYDFGYLGPSELSLRLRSAFETIGRMEHYQGHLLNWYETKNLQPLLPRYVSTVDSGNLAGCLWAMAQGCREVAGAPLRRPALWDGLIDTLDVLEEVTRTGLAPSDTAPLDEVMSRIRAALMHARTRPAQAYATLRTLCDETTAELDRAVIALLESGAYRHEGETLRALRAWMDKLHQKLAQTRREIESLLPWLWLHDEPAAAVSGGDGAWGLSQIPAECTRRLTGLERWEEELRESDEWSHELAGSAARFRDALEAAKKTSEQLVSDLEALADRAEAEVRGMDFKLLYDRERRLFHIGHNVTQDKLDGHHYDLLASEARLASYVAIVKRDVPETHWYALGRPMAPAAGRPALMSWGGTMFEFLMPELLMQSRPGTLLAQTCEAAVDAQIAHADRGAPWGVSESAFAKLDDRSIYQYRSFGVPGLGFKRGLEDDRVVAPYASVLAASLRPRAVLENVKKLTSMGALGTYGLFEAVDFRPDRVPDGRPYSVVRSYMAHHQGMLLVALDNCLHESVMVRRFHDVPWVRTGEMLLNERAPATTPAEWSVPLMKQPATASAGAEPPGSSPWSPVRGERPQAFLLGNGRLSSVLTDAGGGGLSWQGLALTSYGADRGLDEEGIWLHVREERAGLAWLATSARGRTSVSVGRAELHRRKHGVSVRVDVAVAPSDDVEVRRITVHNETNRHRRLTLTSVGEPVLLPERDAQNHPAFAKLFIESDVAGELEGILFARRARSPRDEQAVMVHRLVREGSAVTFEGYESDRLAFFGRGGSPRRPAALAGTKGLRGRTGAVLDPIMALMAGIELKPKATVSLAFVTAVARSKGAALELARRYGSMHAVRWALRDAEQEGLRRLRRLGVAPDLVPSIQALFSSVTTGEPFLRAPAETLLRTRPAQHRLWGRGISGDDPIVLVRVRDAQSSLLSEVVAAHRYLRLLGARIDLVLVDERASGYLDDGVESLRRVVLKDDEEDGLSRKGGIFLVAGDQLSADDRAQLECSARAVLDTKSASLAAVLAAPQERPTRLPRLEPSRSEDSVSRSAAAPGLLFDNGLGGFGADGREYFVRVRPGTPTPAPWCNVLANPTFGCLVSESSLGSTWSMNAGENRLTPWRNDPVFDTPSETLYLRDEETAAVWSPTPLPAGGHGEVLVAHGAGYTRYARHCHGLEQELTVFVPPDAALKIVRLRVKNTLPRHRRLTATYFVEWVLGARRHEQEAFVTTEAVPSHHCILASSSWRGELSGRVAFVASSLKLHGFTADRVEFLGRQGDRERPPALERWGLSGAVGAGLDPCAALQVHLELEPDASYELHFVLGQAPDRSEALELAARFREGAVVDTAWGALTSFWEELLGSVQVKTPEPAMDLMLNRWLLYQSVSARLFGRTGFYQSSGAFGFRDQLQDVMALLHAAPARARAHILEAAAHQFEEGDVLHWWHPPAGQGVRTHCSDDLLWLPYVVAEYVRATGDTRILHESIPFLTGERLRLGEHDHFAQFKQGASPGTLLEHCRRAIEHGWTEGQNGLPLMGDGDWNDGMNRVGAEGRGESVWLAWFLFATAQRFADLCDRVDEPIEAARVRERAEGLRQATERAAWDGGWYVRAFHDDGSVLGSRRSRECTIDSIAQSWAVISSAAEPVRARAAVRAASKALILEEDRLVLLLRPPFDSALHDPGYIRAYPPGVRENGGQYTHAASWLGWALVELGDGAAAEHLFRLLNPLLRAGSPEACARYGVEPYVLAADVYGRPPWIGRGGWTWYTGAAAWTYRLGVEGILGLRREAGRLRVDPCSPPYWGGFEAWVHEGDAELHVIVEDPDGVGKGVVSMSMDGVTLASTGALLEASTPGRHELKVRLGAPVGVLRLPGATRDQAAKVRPSANPSPGDRTAKPG